MQEFKTLIQNMTSAAQEVIKTYYRTGFDVDHKGDDSPVTIADREVEKRLREIIETNRPDDGFLGEEHGTKPSQNGLMWVVDPIDGTKSFVAGRPSFTTLIALWEGDIPLLGAVYQPITNELWLGTRDDVTTLNGNAVSVSKKSNPHKLRIGSTIPSLLYDQPELLHALRDTSDFFVWSGDGYFCGMMACGGLDVIIEKDMKTYDYAAHPAIITGAGGYVCDWNGKPMTLESEGHILCTSNETIRDHVLEIIDTHK